MLQRSANGASGRGWCPTGPDADAAGLRCVSPLPRPDVRNIHLHRPTLCPLHAVTVVHALRKSARARVCVCVREREEYREIDLSHTPRAVPCALPQDYDVPFEPVYMDEQGNWSAPLLNYAEKRTEWQKYIDQTFYRQP